MKLVIYDHEAHGDEVVEAKVVNDMAFLYASHHKIKESDDNSFLELAFGIHDEDGETYVINSTVRVDERDSDDMIGIEQIKETGAILDESLDGFNFSKMAFFCDNRTGTEGTSDFICRFNEEIGLYEFFATVPVDDGHWKHIWFRVTNKDILIGIGLINQCIATCTFSSDCFYEANLWFGNTADRSGATYYSANSFKMLECSAPIKADKKEFNYVVAFNLSVNALDTSKPDTIVCVMNVTLDKKYKNKEFVDLNTLKNKYKDAFSIGKYTGMFIEEPSKTTKQLLAFKDNEFKVVEMTQNNFNALSDMIGAYPSTF